MGRRLARCGDLDSEKEPASHFPGLAGALREENKADQEQHQSRPPTGRLSVRASEGSHIPKRHGREYPLYYLNIQVQPFQWG